MFEQSIVLEPQPGRKIGAIAGSVGAQILAIGVLVLVPLLYNEVLPLVRPALPLTPPSLSRPPEAVVQRTATATQQRYRVDRVFTLPRPNAINYSHPVITEDSAPIGDPNTIGVPNAPPSIGPVSTMSRISVPTAPEPTPVAKPAPTPAKPNRISLGAEPAVIIKRVLPIYPDIAKKTRTSGTVRLMGVIAKDGTVQELKVISGHPLLIPAALEAVRQWVYRPTLLSGEPVEVACPIDVIFKLSQ
jgi:protein TonB